MNEPRPPTGSPGRRVRVLIADDHPIFREGLRRLLEHEGRYQVVGEAPDGADAVRLARQLTPDILLLDLAMPRLPGLDALRELGAGPDAARTILLTAAIERPDIVRALQYGARGVVLKDAATQLLYQCIDCVMRGEFWIGRRSVGGLVEALREMAPPARDSERPHKFGLTKRELEVVEAVVSGLTNKDIAQQFGLSEDTIKHHLTNIFDKTGVSNRLELALFAINHRVVEL